MYDNLKLRVNFWSNGDVISNDGEILGTWARDAEDHPSFTPTGATEALIWATQIPMLSGYVAKWLDAGGDNNFD